MKITPKQYASALCDLCLGKEKEKVKPAVRRLAEILLANNDILKLEEVISEFYRIWQNRQGIVEAEIINARALDADIVKLLKTYIKKLANSEQVVLKEKLDKNILGGIVIKYRDKILDASLRAKIDALKENMKK